MQMWKLGCSAPSCQQKEVIPKVKKEATSAAESAWINVTPILNPCSGEVCYSGTKPWDQTAKEITVFASLIKYNSDKLTEIILRFLINAVAASFWAERGVFAEPLVYLSCDRTVLPTEIIVVAIEMCTTVWISCSACNCHFLITAPQVGYRLLRLK